jgi:predicted esterase YcpF (UPF0227 family)
MSQAPSHLLYLHGFRSSPRSGKALRLQAWLAGHRPSVTWHCPQLPASPKLAMQLVDQVLGAWPVGRFAVIGSSLGGFYATCAAESWGCPAALLNPAVNPARDLAAHVGLQTAYHDATQTYEFTASFVDELRALAPQAITRPERYGGVIARGDELLDWREMATPYAGSAVEVVDGSDHALSDFDDHLPILLRFLQLTP